MATTTSTDSNTFQALTGRFAGPLSAILASEGQSPDIGSLSAARFTDLVHTAAELLRRMDWQPKLVDGSRLLFGAWSDLTDALAAAPQDQEQHLADAVPLLESALYAWDLADYELR